MDTTSPEYRAIYHYTDDTADGEQSMGGFVSISHIERWAESMKSAIGHLVIDRIDRCEVTRTPWIEVKQGLDNSPTL